jgi:signal transduction histidine kinase
MEDISLHVMDIVENSITGGAKCVEIEISEDMDRLRITIRDDGDGMDREQVARASDPFYTTKEGKSYGLGISLYRQAAEETGGTVTVISTPREGTTVSADFIIEHPDMKPMGDIAGTVRLLRAFHPEIDFLLMMNKRGGKSETQA